MTNEQKCTCKGVLGHSRQCALFDESKMEVLHRKALAMGDDPGVLGGAAGASEGQAEPIYQARSIGMQSWGDQSKDGFDHMAKYPAIFETRTVYLHPSAEIAALRERIAGMEKDADAGKNRRFEIRQGGMTVAATEGPGVDAYRDAVHYFWQYQQDATEDEPVEMVELTTVMRIDTPEKQG